MKKTSLKVTKNLNVLVYFIRSIAIDIFVKVGSELTEIEGAYESLLGDNNWRSHLVAYVCLVVTKNKSFLDPLKNRFELGSMVSPQIAVALMRLHLRDMMEFMPQFISNNVSEKSPTAVGACVASHQSLLSPNKVVLPEMSVDIERYCLGINVYNEHYSFWQKFLGGTRC